MSGLASVLALALLPAAGNFAGGLLAEWTRPSPRALNWALHAASGIVIAIVAVELVPRSLDNLSGWWVGTAFAAGGALYLAAESAIERLLGSAATRMGMIYLAAAMDLLSDGLMIGSGGAVSMSLALTLAAGQVLADVPEGYAAVANFRDKGVGRGRRMALSASFAVPIVSAAPASFFLLRDAPPAAKFSVLALVSGLLTVAAVEDMLEEAHASAGDTRRSIVAFVGGFTLFTFVTAGLGD